MEHELQTLFEATLKDEQWENWKFSVYLFAKNKHDYDDLCWSPCLKFSILLPRSQMRFWKRRRKAANCKDRAGKTQNQVERQAQKSRWFQSFCPRPFILIENTKRERRVESGNANYSSALPLLCFRNVERGTRRSFNSHHQHRAMLANLTAQSNHSWHTGSFTPSNIFPLPSVFYWKYYSSPCELEDALQISVLWLV